MNRWKNVRLGDVCEVVSGSTPSTRNPDYWVGTVLLSSRAPIGKVAIAGAEMCCNQGFKNLICSNRIDNRYLYRYLKNRTEYLNNLGRGATFKEISKAIVENVAIPLPPLDVQRKIADVLDRAAAFIEKRKAQIEKLDLLVKSRFVDMFGDPVTNPMEWEIKRICELAKVMTGATPSRAKDEYYIGGKIPWVKTGEIAKGLIYETDEYITKKALSETNCKIFPVDTIMVAMYGVGKTRGESGILKIPAATNQACAAILPSEKINTLYLHHYLKMQYEVLRELGRGAQQINLNLDIVKSFPLMLPPLDIQSNFADFVCQVDKAKKVFKQSLRKLEDNYYSLMQNCFRGEIF